MNFKNPALRIVTKRDFASDFKILRFQRAYHHKKKG